MAAEYTPPPEWWANLRINEQRVYDGARVAQSLGRPAILGRSPIQLKTWTADYFPTTDNPRDRRARYMGLHVSRLVRFASLRLDVVDREHIPHPKLRYAIDLSRERLTVVENPADPIDFEPGIDPRRFISMLRKRETHPPNEGDFYVVATEMERGAGGGYDIHPPKVTV